MIPFENWIVRILLGGGGTKAKNPSKAITAKHASYTAKKGQPARMVHGALWRIAQPAIGSA